MSSILHLHFVIMQNLLCSHSKALFYGKRDVAERIMMETQPSIIKRMGRGVMEDDRFFIENYD